ncbi:MAG: type II and III secretion system protein, partial [Acidobacteriota bacterium]|nr:type II and III secretion system protein [Acidobacteriota bacterium]
MSILACALVVNLALAASLAASEASDLFRDGKRAEKSGQIARAYLLYSEAAALDSRHKLYRLKTDALRSRAALEAKATASAAPDSDEIAVDPDLNPEEQFDSMTSKELSQAREPLPPPELHAKPGRRAIDLQGDSKSLFEQVARMFDLDTVFDGDFTPGKPMRFSLADADYRDALEALDAATGSFVVPLSPKLFMVAKDTPPKRNDLEQNISVTVPIPQFLSTQQLVEAAQAVRQAMGIEKMAWDSLSGQLVIRDRVSRVIPAQRLLSELLTLRAEVIVDLEFIEINYTDMLNIGVNLPTNYPLVYLGRFLHASGTIPSTFANLAVFGGGRTLFGVGLADAQMLASMMKASARTLLTAQVRSIDGQAATFHAGDKYPIVTAQYRGSAAPSGGSLIQPPPSFTFEDLGVTLKMTPHVHGTDGVSLDIDTEFKVLAGQALNGIPIIANRKLTSQVRLRDDQWGIVAGLVSTQNARTVSGVAWLSRLPLIGNLFRNVTVDKERKQVLIVIKPRLIGLPPDQN